MAPTRRFKNRLQAGKQLALALRAYTGRDDAIVLALPRGGVPVGFAVARALGLELDLLLVRKLGLPGHEEFAMGAVGNGGIRVLNPTAIAQHKVSAQALDAACTRELHEIARRERQYRGGRPPPNLRGRTVILVDDGLATGSTMHAAIAVARTQAPARIVVAVPVGAPDSCAALAPLVDQLVCPLQPPLFRAVGQWYQQFGQTGDDEVQDLLALAWRQERQSSPSQATKLPSSSTKLTGGHHESSVATRSSTR